MRRWPREYIGGYFDLALNRDFGLRALFDNSLRNAPVKPAALQWRFGALTEAIDEFDCPESAGDAARRSDTHRSDADRRSRRRDPRQPGQACPPQHAGAC
jgi:hypothetical protein